MPVPNSFDEKKSDVKDENKHSNKNVIKLVTVDLNNYGRQAQQTRKNKKIETESNLKVISKELSNMQIDKEKTNSSRNYKTPNNEKFKKNVNKISKVKNKVCKTNQNEECSICYDYIKRTDPIWTCQICYQSFHLNCMKDWCSKILENPANSIANCYCPICKDSLKKELLEYYCYCGKTKNPADDVYLDAHSCGMVCLKNLNSKFCIHQCTRLCHKGPCDKCSANVTVTCQCAKEHKSIRCLMINDSNQLSFLCQNPCMKQLNCGLHYCRDKCHYDECENCSIILDEYKCYCGRTSINKYCGSSNNSRNNSCDNVCGKLLSCKQHYCQKICHPNECYECHLSPNIIKTCPCGKVSMEEMNVERVKCTDDIPTCSNLCSKPLFCTEKNNQLITNHQCMNKCHIGACSPCSSLVKQNCQCKSISRTIECSKIQDQLNCNKICGKILSCGRHYCSIICCSRTMHICSQKCEKLLPCKKHHCQYQCHGKKTCPPCQALINQPQSCPCGFTSLPSSTPCYVNLPKCHQLCRKNRSCDHPVNHLCHSDSVQCPPCMVPTKKTCSLNHVNIEMPCAYPMIYCNEKCTKTLECGHKCGKICHSGQCNIECKQLCNKARSKCIHNCLQSCHSNSCDEYDCIAKVKASCKCGFYTSEILCKEITELVHIFNAKFYIGSLDNSTNINDFSSSLSLYEVFEDLKQSNMVRILSCDDECKKNEFHLNVATALQTKDNYPNKPYEISFNSFSTETLMYLKSNKDLVKDIDLFLTNEIEEAIKKGHSTMTNRFTFYKRNYNDSKSKSNTDPCYIWWPNLARTIIHAYKFLIINDSKGFLLPVSKKYNVNSNVFYLTCVVKTITFESVSPKSCLSFTEHFFGEKIV